MKIIFPNAHVRDTHKLIHNTVNSLYYFLHGANGDSSILILHVKGFNVQEPHQIQLQSIESFHILGDSSWLFIRKRLYLSHKIMPFV